MTDQAERAQFRKAVSECILATDMAFHVKMKTDFEALLSENDIVDGKNVDSLIDHTSKET